MCGKAWNLLLHICKEWEMKELLTISLSNASPTFHIIVSDLGSYVSFSFHFTNYALHCVGQLHNKKQ